MYPVSAGNLDRVECRIADLKQVELVFAAASDWPHRGIFAGYWDTLFNLDLVHLNMWFTGLMMTGGGGWSRGKV
jgi:hypothetical protein